MLFIKSHAKTVLGTTKNKPEDASKLAKRNISDREIWKTIHRAQILQTMRGKTTSLLTFKTLVFLTKAITGSEKY